MARKKTFMGTTPLFPVVSKAPKSSLQIPLPPPNLLENKIQLSKWEDQAGFIQKFMNRAASHLAHSEELQGAVRNGRLL